jgi:hypothetical protein
MQRLSEKELGAREAAAELEVALAGIVDDQFCAQCSIAGVEDGALLIDVASPGLVYGIRRRWEEPILKGLRRRARGRRIRRVVFRFGGDCR